MVLAISKTRKGRTINTKQIVRLWPWWHSQHTPLENCIVESILLCHRFFLLRADFIKWKRRTTEKWIEIGFIPMLRLVHFINLFCVEEEKDMTTARKNYNYRWWMNGTNILFSAYQSFHTRSEWIEHSHEWATIIRMNSTLSNNNMSNNICDEPWIRCPYRRIHTTQRKIQLR